MVFFFAGSLSLWFVGLLLSCLPSIVSRYHFRFKMRWGSDPLHVAWMDVTNEVPCRNQLQQHQAGFAIRRFFLEGGGGCYTSPLYRGLIKMMVSCTCFLVILKGGASAALRRQSGRKGGRASGGLTTEGLIWGLA